MAIELLGCAIDFPDDVCTALINFSTRRMGVAAELAMCSKAAVSLDVFEAPVADPKHFGGD